MPLCHKRIEALIAFCVSGLELRDKEKMAPTRTPPFQFRVCVVG